MGVFLVVGKEYIFSSYVSISFNNPIILNSIFFYYFTVNPIWQRHHRAFWVKMSEALSWEIELTDSEREGESGGRVIISNPFEKKENEVYCTIEVVV